MTNENRLQLLLIDSDPIFRLGLLTAFEQFPNLQVVAEVESTVAAWEILEAGISNSLDLVILDLVFDSSYSTEETDRQRSLQFCQQLKTQHPHLPILLLTAVQEPTFLSAARSLGIDGYCPKGIAISQLVTVLCQIASGEQCWMLMTPTANVQLGSTSMGLLVRLLNSSYLSGLQQIKSTENQLENQLQNPALSILNRAIVVGQLRELRAVRWIIKQLLSPVSEMPSRKQSSSPSWRKMPSSIPAITSREPHSVGGSSADEDRETSLVLESVPSQSLAVKSKVKVTKSLQETLFTSTNNCLQYSLTNLTGVPLEIDCFREEKKRELLSVILYKLEEVVNELRFCEVEASQLLEEKERILQDLWSEAMREFFGKYYRLNIGDHQLEIIPALRQDAAIVSEQILSKIPLVFDLFSHLLYQAPLLIDNVPYSAGTPEAIERSQWIMQNLIIRVANGIVQPLLNQFADSIEVKQIFYETKLISSRNIERFRNDLSWNYRQKQWFGEAKAIFESKYYLFVFDVQGIKKISIYASRRQELEQLSGIQQTVTLLLEIRDAIAPRLQSTIALIGSGIVYLLTQIIGRGLGLIGRGILQGLGNSRLEK